MSERPVVHHIGLCVSDCNETLLKLRKFGFKVFAKRNATYCKQFAAKLGDIIFLVSQRTEETTEYSNGHLCSKVEEEPFTLLCCNGRHLVDSVYNICFSVKDVEKTTKAIENVYPSLVIQSPKTISNNYGSVTYSVIASNCGNVLNTLINVNNYCGIFLPGFVSYDDDEEPKLYEQGEKSINYVTHIDHITLACFTGHSNDVIKFYQSFGMKKFSISREDNDDGLILDGGVGLRLKAMEYFHCVETGVIYPSTEERNAKSVMIVVVESLPAQTNCNVETFLKEHGGEGIEHIAFSSKNIVHTCDTMYRNGVRFRKPPASYYRRLKKVTTKQISEDIDKLERYGILLDNEMEPCSTENGGIEIAPKYLMQIFSHPVFTKKFFIEIIKRSNGAKGLGAGNIIALVRSIREEEEEEKKKEENNNAALVSEEISNPRRIC